MTEWISVNDSHPSTDRDVLVYDGNVIDIGNYDEKDEMWAVNIVDELSVTHWMDLPAPPDKEEGSMK